MAHVNEFNPLSRDAVDGVQRDDRKLKFNNIRLCLAVIICVYHRNEQNPSITNISHLIGIHLGTNNFDDDGGQFNTGLERLKKALEGESLFDIHLVGSYEHNYARYGLAARLRTLKPQQIRSYNITGVSPKIKIKVRPFFGMKVTVKPGYLDPAKDDDAASDVKAVVEGNRLKIYGRPNVVRPPGRVLKDKFNPEKEGGVAFSWALHQGRNEMVNDRDAKPWQILDSVATL